MVWLAFPFGVQLLSNMIVDTSYASPLMAVLVVLACSLLMKGYGRTWGLVGLLALVLSLIVGKIDYTRTIASLIAALVPLFSLSLNLTRQLLPTVNVVGTVGLLVALGGIANQGFRPTRQQANEAGAAHYVRTPNIYHIVLDGYGRSDVLRNMYQFDDPLTRELTPLGFQFSKEARANYVYTVHSLGSVLHGRYLTHQEAEAGQGYAFLNRPEFIDRARKNGYWTETYVTLDNFMPIRNAHRMDLWRSATTYFEDSLLAQWGFKFDRGANDGVQHAKRVEFVLDAMKPVESGSPPTYRYFHVISPHPPFVFNRDGTTRPGPKDLKDGGELVKSDEDRERYIADYRDQAEAIAHKTIEKLRGIIAGDPNALIILHSDHGPRSQVSFNEEAKGDLWETQGALFAVYGPNEFKSHYRDQWYLVNTLNALEGYLSDKPYNELPGRYYYHRYGYQYNPKLGFQELPYQPSPQTSIPANSE